MHLHQLGGSPCPLGTERNVKGTKHGVSPAVLTLLASPQDPAEIHSLIVEVGLRVSHPAKDRSKSQPLAPVNVSLFGNRVFAEEIKGLKRKPL